MTLLIAHSGHPPQPLLDDTPEVPAHAPGVARLAREFAAAFDSGAVADWLGWWHDAGKVAPDVQSYLNDENATPPGPDHSSVGMLAALDAFEPLAFNVAGHHGGLADRGNLKARVERKRGEARVVEALETARPLLAERTPRLGPDDVPALVCSEHTSELWLRMLHSALVDADCLDTERFFDPDKHALRERDDDLAPLWDALCSNQERLMEGSKGDVNAARAEVYHACIEAAEKSPGVYRLTVPTGGGKTRSAMAFALKHALMHDQRRVVVALPYTSIIEQNADVYRGVFRGANPDAVLEHHSAVAGHEKAGEASEAELRARLAAQNWDAPIIVTTTVQLLESLFANRNSRVRKLHRLARSVVVLDEVQTLPIRLLDPTLDVLRALVRDYGVTVLLCTATPPALAARDGFTGFEHVEEIVADPLDLFRRLKRVEYEIKPEPWTWERAADAMQAESRALAILNTKKDALALLDHLPTEDGLFHLSTLLCGAHRRVVLAEVRRRLEEEKPVRLVSTQVVEAGVDLDFPLVLRALGPLDRIIQAAGRCNREMKLGVRGGRVIVFEPVEGGLPPGEYRAGAEKVGHLLREDPNLDFDDPTVVERYFRLLYAQRDTDRDGVQRLRAGLNFEQTARAYRLIEDEGVPVVVCYRPEQERIDAVLERVKGKGVAKSKDFRDLQPFLVTLRTDEHERAQREGLCAEVVPDVWEWTGEYHPLRGLVWDIPTNADTCVV